MKCPKCGERMASKCLKEPYGVYYLAWVCDHCGYEERIIFRPV